MSPNWNLGQQYEASIRSILKGRDLLPSILEGNDAGFIHRGATHYVEIKNINAPDFGQKGLVWSAADGWQWRIKDNITEMYDQFGVINKINKSFVPKRYSVATEKLTVQDRSYDQREFEQTGIELDVGHLYAFYSRKKCNYIQIEGRGFYFMENDIAGLSAPRFSAKLTLRLRAKTHHSFPVHNYSFFAVIQVKKNSIYQSKYDLEEKVGVFPPITK